MSLNTVAVAPSTSRGVRETLILWLTKSKSRTTLYQTLVARPVLVILVVAGSPSTTRSVRPLTRP